MKKIITIVTTLLIITTGVYAKTITGELNEKYTNTKITGAAILIKGKSVAVKSDDNGSFTIEVDDGDYLKIIKKGYKIEEVSTSNSAIYLELERDDIVYGKEVKVTTKRKEIIQKEVSKTVITGEELRSVPQAAFFSDVTNAVATMPGVVRSGEFSSLMYIRGGEPYEVLNVLNDLPILNPYRWGGKTTIFNNELVKTVSLYSGGFGAKYPEAMSGVLDVEYKEGNPKEHEGMISLGAETMAAFNGPMPGDGTYLASYRRSFYDIFMNQGSKDTDKKVKYPYFEDFYLQDIHKITPNDTLKLWLLNSTDGMNFYMSDEDEEGKNSKAGDKFEYKQISTIGTGEWKHMLNDRSYTKLLLSYNETALPVLKLKMNEFISEDYKVRQGTFTGIGEYNLTWRNTNNFKFGMGSVLASVKELDIQADIKMYNEETGEFEDKSYSTTIDDVKKKTVGINFGYIENEFKMDKISLTPGVSFLYNEVMKANNASYDPRVAARYEIDPKTFIKFATGQYTAHTLDYSIAKDNPAIKPEKTYHYVLGGEKEINDNHKLRLEFYYKDMCDLLVDDPQEENTTTGGAYKYIKKNIGKGYSEGIELFFQQKESETSPIDGWISYTYAITKKNLNTKDRTDWFYPEQDQRHTLNVTTNYKIINKKKYDMILRSKLDFHSGRPYQDFDIVKAPLKHSDGTTENVYISVPKKDKYIRLPEYLRWDITLESTNHYKHFDFTSFIQLMNVTNHKNVESYSVSLYEGKKEETIGFQRMIFGGFKVTY